MEGKSTDKKDYNTCSLNYALKLISSKWKLPIIWALSQNKKLRYNELRREVSGITNMMLAQSLKELESQGIVLRIQYMEIPPRVEYSLGESGQELIDALSSLAKWGKRMKDKSL